MAQSFALPCGSTCCATSVCSSSLHRRAVATKPNCFVASVHAQRSLATDIDTFGTHGHRLAPGLLRGSVQCRAGAMDGMPAWTLDQIAGLAFGAVLIAFVVSAKQVDVFVAKAQRRQLGLCEECGGVYDPATCQQQGCPSKQKSSN